jgi:hypothetical protein
MADFSNLKKPATGSRLGSPPTESIPVADTPENTPAPASADISKSTPKSKAVDAVSTSTRDARIDGRSLRRSSRVVQFATRVTPEFDQEIRAIAQRDGLMIVEVLEKALAIYKNR